MASGEPATRDPTTMTSYMFASLSGSRIRFRDRPRLLRGLACRVEVVDIGGIGRGDRGSPQFPRGGQQSVVNGEVAVHNSECADRFRTGDKGIRVVDRGLHGGFEIVVG